MTHYAIILVIAAILTLGLGLELLVTYIAAHDYEIVQGGGK